MENRVDIKCEGDPGHAYVVSYINGERLPFCEKIILNYESNPGKITFVPGEWPQVLIKDPEMDLSQFVGIATIILQNELLKHGDLYKGFLASIKSAIYETENQIVDVELSKNILKRIIGEE